MCVAKQQNGAVERGSMRASPPTSANDQGFSRKIECEESRKAPARRGGAVRGRGVRRHADDERPPTRSA
jgi:hypothetical protein